MMNLMMCPCHAGNCGYVLQNCTAVLVLFEESRLSSTLKLKDINNFIEYLQKNEVIYNNAQENLARLNKDKGYVALSSRELDEIINKVADDVYNEDYNKYRHRSSNPNRLKHYQSENQQDRDLQQLSLGQQQWYQKPGKAALSNLEKSSIDLGFNNGNIFNDDDHKVYLILNREHNLNENNFRDITGLLSQILSGSANNIYPKRDNTRISKTPRYKGFVIADARQARRRNRESKELYSQQNSLEDFKPKRARSDYGGAGGRTPIPYIRHRDIYERE